MLIFILHFVIVINKIEKKVWNQLHLVQKNQQQWPQK